MAKKVMCLALCWLVIGAVTTPHVLGASKEEEEARLVEKVKAGIAKLGTGPEARIEVRLKDKTKLRGYVAEIAEDHFAVTDPKTGVTKSVPYPQVKQVKGNNLSTGVKIAIAVVIVLAILAFIGTKVD